MVLEETTNKSLIGTSSTAAIFWRVITVAFVLPDSIRERLAFSELQRAASCCCTMPFALLISRILEPRFKRHSFSSFEYLFKAVVFYINKDIIKTISDVEFLLVCIEIKAPCVRDKKREL